VIVIKNASQIEKIRQASSLAAQTLNFIAGLIRPGVSTLSLNDIAHKYIVDHHAIPATLGYGGYPKSICTSINNVVCHGIPSAKQILKEGDIINIDVTPILDGYYGDTSATYPVGHVSAKAADLIEKTKTALDLSIQSLAPGLPLNDCVGKIIEPYIEKFGYSVVRELGGHGVGLKFHEDPFVFHYDTGDKKPILNPGMIFTIAPMINASSNCRVSIDSNDGWTVRTVDGSLSAQFEHTVLITDSGYEILTKL